MKRWRRYQVDDVVSCIALWVMDESLHEKFGNNAMRDKFFNSASAKAYGFEGHATSDEEFELNGDFTIRSLGLALGLIPRSNHGSLPRRPTRTKKSCKAN